MGIPIEKAAGFFRRALDKLTIIRANRKAGKVLKRLAELRIDRSRDAYGQPFIPNSPFTIAQKGGRSKPLIDSGKMKRGYFVKIKNRELNIFNKQTYAINHQLGIDVPQRVVLDAERDIGIVLDIYAEMLNRNNPAEF